MDGVTYRDIFEESGIKILRTKNGRYRWKVESKESFASPFAAMRDAMTVIGERPIDSEEKTEEIAPESWPKITVQAGIDWEPIIPLK